MNFLKKYWWVILLVLAGIFAYYWFMISEAKKPIVKTPTCTKVTQTVYDERVQEYVDNIKAKPEWLADIIARKDSSETDDQAVEKNADWMVRTSDKLCVG